MPGGQGPDLAPDYQGGTGYGTLHLMNLKIK